MPAATAVPVDETPSGSASADYADAFEVRLSELDDRTAEEWIRAGLEGAPAPLRWTIVSVHRYVLRFRLGPLSAPDRILGWRVAESTPEVVRLEAGSPLLRAVLVGRRTDDRATRLTTLLFFTRPTVMRAVWTLVGPLHRRIAPYLLARAARAR